MVASGRWAVHRSADGMPFFCAVLEGSCRLAIAGRDAVTLAAGDFVLLPSAHAFTASSSDGPIPPVMTDPVATGPGAYRVGDDEGPPDMRLLVGHCAFGGYEPRLLLSLLPEVVHLRGQRRLLSMVELFADEHRNARPGRDVVLARLLDVLLIEAFRATGKPTAAAGLLRGLADERLATALRRMHERPERNWTVLELARNAGLSRSIFFDRFRRALGVAPMEYLLGWRMALAQDLLRRNAAGLGAVAARVGYGSASTFSVAFARHVGMPPAAFARASRAP